MLKVLGFSRGGARREKEAAGGFYECLITGFVTLDLWLLIFGPCCFLCKYAPYLRLLVNIIQGPSSLKK